jgi:uncharacterized membrane protein YecN with MAPEG domain
MQDFRWPALITLGVVALLFVFAGAVGKARAKYNIKAPATTGDPAFERTFRAHQNTVENALIFLPALWLFAEFVSGMWAAALGAVWIAARVWYFVAYQEDTAKRGRPFGLLHARVRDTRSRRRVGRGEGVLLTHDSREIRKNAGILCRDTVLPNQHSLEGDKPWRHSSAC